MTESEKRKAKALHEMMLNQLGISELAKLYIYKKLILSLSESDFKELENEKIYFNPIFSPASISDLTIDLCKGGKIITLDINSFKKLSSNEGIAIILHEIGHALNPDKKGEQGEFIADDYAKDRNYRDSLISSLEKGKELWPEQFLKDITEKRIRRLKNNPAPNPEAGQ